MGIKNKISSGYIYFLTLTVVDWVDIFTRPVYKHVIVDSLDYCIKNKGLKIYAWCLMTNHLHLIAGVENDENLSDILRDFKKFTSKENVFRITNPRLYTSGLQIPMSEFELIACNEIVIENDFISGINFDFIAGGGYIEPCEEAQITKKTIMPFNSNSNDSIINLNDSIIIFPNPFNKSLQINYNINDEAPIEIYLLNSLGIRIKQIYNGAELQKGIILDTQSLLSGIYIIEFKSRTISKNYKIIKLSN